MFFTELYNILIWALGIFFLIKMMQNPALIYHFPYMMSFGFVVFVLPQVFVIQQKQIFSIDVTNRLFLMTLLCWSMSFLGWFGFKPRFVIFKETFLGQYDEEKAGLAGAALVTLGVLFNFMAYRILTTQEFENQQATGIVTIFIFLQQLLFLGTGLSLSLWLKHKRKICLVFAVLGLLYGFYIGVLQGRRTQTLYTLMVLGVPLYVKLAIKPSRIIIVSFLVMAFLIVPSMGQYRQILKTSDNTSEFFQRLFSEMDFGKNLKDFYVNAKSIELVNAGYMIDHTYKNNDYTLGSGYWNELVTRFVPAQFVGPELKKALKLKVTLMPRSSDKQAKYNPNYVLGSTNTGIGDSFKEFDYFGSFFFFLVGMFMRRLWHSIEETRNPFMQALYAVLLIEGVVGLTHGTTWFLPGFFTALIFLGLSHKYAKIS